MFKQAKELPAHVMEQALESGRVAPYTWSNGGSTVDRLIIKWGQLRIIV